MLGVESWGCCILHLNHEGDGENKKAYNLPDAAQRSSRSGGVPAEQREHGEGTAHQLQYLEEENFQGCSLRWRSTGLITGKEDGRLMAGPGEL